MKDVELEWEARMREVVRNLTGLQEAWKDAMERGRSGPAKLADVATLGRCVAELDAVTEDARRYLSPGAPAPRRPTLYLTGLCDSNGREMKVGDLVRMKNTMGHEVHGNYADYEVRLQGGVPILSYVCSETGAALPPGYLAQLLSDLYDRKLFMFTDDTKRLTPYETEVEVVDWHPAASAALEEWEQRLRSRRQRAESEQ